VTQHESEAIEAWAKAHTGVFELTKLGPKDEALRATATEAWNAIQRLYEIAVAAQSSPDAEAAR
jgi:hypothetical protein